LGSEDETRLDIEVMNPNSDWGIVRGTYELAVLDSSGSVLEVTGKGLPGTQCCTIYQLAPGGTYAFSPFTRSASNAVSYEIRVTSGWTEWAPIAAKVPVVTVSGAAFRSDPFVGGQRSLSATGRVTVSRGGPYNVWVFALVEGSDGFIYEQALVECLSAGSDAAFEASDLAVPPANAALTTVWAITTTVPGVGSVSRPPGC